MVEDTFLKLQRVSCLGLLVSDVNPGLLGIATV